MPHGTKVGEQQAAATMDSTTPPAAPRLVRLLFVIGGALALSVLYLAWAYSPEASNAWITLLSGIPLYALAHLVLAVLFRETYLATWRHATAARDPLRKNSRALLTPLLVLLQVLFGLRTDPEPEVHPVGPKERKTEP